MKTTTICLGFAAFLIAISIILPWGTFSAGGSYWTYMKSHTESVHGSVFAFGVFVEAKSTSESLYGYTPEINEYNAYGTFPFQIVVVASWLIGLVSILIGLRYRRMTLIGGMISLFSVGFFIVSITGMNRDPTFDIGDLRIVGVGIKNSSGCITMVLGSVIATIVGLYTFLTTKKVKEGPEVTSEESDANLTISNNYTN